MITFQKVNEKEVYNGPPRSGSTFTYASQLKASILFGGCKEADVYLFDHSKAQWTLKPTAGKKPSNRVYHAATFIEHISSLLVTGGQDDTGKSLEDFFILSVKDWKWKKIVIQKQPTPRHQHCLLPLNTSEFIIFGGISMPYNQCPNDTWSLSVKMDKGKGDHCVFEGTDLKIRGAPEGRCLSDGTVMLRDRIFTACYAEEKETYELYCLQLRKKAWKKLDFKFSRAEIKLFKVITHQREESFLVLSQQPQRKTPAKYFLFQQENSKLQVVSSRGSSLVDECDQLWMDSRGEQQVVCVSLGKKLRIAEYKMQQMVQSGGSIQDYLIAIKHEQILSQELLKKNAYLQQLYKEMQNYITILNKEYYKYEEDANVENEKLRHIEDCKNLKSEYGRLDKLYEEVCSNIKFLRGELGAINQDFERCMETEFDEQA